MCLPSFFMECVSLPCVLSLPHVTAPSTRHNTRCLLSPPSFGITPTMEKLYHQGVMRSKVDDCQFVCIRQTDYYRILHQSEENIRRHEENGVLVLVTELQPIDAGNRKGHIVIKVLQRLASVQMYASVQDQRDIRGCL